MKFKCCLYSGAEGVVNLIYHQSEKFMYDIIIVAIF